MGCRLSELLVHDGKEGACWGKGHDLPQVSHQEALRILSRYEQPITLQIDGWRGRNHQSHHTSDCSTQTEHSWDDFRGVGVTAGSASRLNAYMDRPCCHHVSLPPGHYGDSQYLPSMPQGVRGSRLDFQDAKLSSCVPKEQSWLIGCCNTNADEPSSFMSQMEDEDPVQDRPLGYLPLLHELDSGLGCTDGSLHQGELSGPDTEEGTEDAERSVYGSPSSESLLSSEPSDSGFYSASTAEFRRFQRLLETRMQLYRAQGGSREQRDGQSSRWDLESIPEGCWDLESIPEGPCCRGVSSMQVSMARGCPSGIAVPWPGPSGAPECSTPWRRASHPTSPSYSRASGRQGSWGGSPDPPERRGQTQADPAAILPREARERCGLALEHPLPRPLPSPLLSPLPRPLPSPLLSPLINPLLSPLLSPRHSPLPRPLLSPRHSPLINPLLSPLPSPLISPLPSPLISPLPSPLPSPRPHPLPRPSGPGRSRRGRSQLLKARASRLADERSEVTTDEEARGEVQTGRYWSRAERRRHLLLAREQRQRRRGRAGGGAGAGGGGGARCSSVLELSHRKWTRLQNRKLLDDWTTVEELLTHGTRANSTEILCSSPLLSVTTV